MSTVLDIHTHHPAPAPEAVVVLSATDLAVSYPSPEDVPLLPEQAYSVGIHPWSLQLQAPSQAAIEMLEHLAERENVVAIGETGLDALRPAPMFRQLQVFHRHIELSERLHKPLIIHDVKAHQEIIELYREYRPAMHWAIHGFHGKPTVADMFTRLGIYLSFGENFNADTLAAMPPELLLAETDESSLSIGEIIGRLSAAAGIDMQPLVAANARTFLSTSSQ